MKVSYEVGNSEIQTTLGEVSTWTKDGMARDYYSLVSTGKPTKTITKLYKVVSGKTSDPSVEINGVIFGYQLGVDFDSKTKKKNAEAAVRELAKHILESGL